jgi:hypothetical protein
MKIPEKLTWKHLLLGVGILFVVFLCTLVVGGSAAYFLSDSNANDSDTMQPAQKATVTKPQKTTPVVKPTLVKTATITPTPEQQETATKNPENPQGKLTGKQQLTENSMFEDFSSNSQGWKQSADENSVFKIEKGAYSIQVVKPGYLDKADIPVKFPPNEISFDVKGQAGDQPGRFGVYCNYLDAKNSYYVEFDLASNEYVISKIKDGDEIPLTKENSSGQYWLPASSLKSPPTSANHIAISCQRNTISLTINETLIDTVDIAKPLDKPGKAAFYLSTYPTTGENGYKVFFGNVKVSQSSPTSPIALSPTEPAPEEPAKENISLPGENLPGKQRFRNNDVFEDFSTNAWGWAESNDGKIIRKIEDGAYSIQVLDPGNVGLSVLSSSIFPNEISFDVKGPPGKQDGHFGVYCNLLDDDNKYYVEFDLAINAYIIVEVKDGNAALLTKKNSDGGDWLPASALISPPTSVNHIDINCYSDSISLSVNKTLVDKVDVTDPLSKPGRGALYAGTIKESGKDGYKVYFDNLRFYQPEGNTSGKSPSSKPSGPADSVGELTGKQQVTDHSIFDDFSSNAFKWKINEGIQSVSKIENETYTIQSFGKKILTMDFFPVDFVPNEIKFDVKGSSDQKDGTVGVYCEYSDWKNKYFVEVDLAAKKYLIEEIKDGKTILLVELPDPKVEWVPTNAIKSPPTTVNHIDISCYLDKISLSINDTLVEQVDIKDPLENPGRGLFYVYTYDFADKDGYSAIFDNVEIFHPVQ